MWDQVGQLYSRHRDIPTEVADAFIGMHGLSGCAGQG